MRQIAATHEEYKGTGAELGVSLFLGPVCSGSPVVAGCVAIDARLVSEHPSSIASCTVWAHLMA